MYWSNSFKLNHLQSQQGTSGQSGNTGSSELLVGTVLPCGNVGRGGVVGSRGVLGRTVSDRLLTRSDGNHSGRDVSLGQSGSGGNGSGGGEDGDGGELHFINESK
jgi:hypothetical protein